MRPRHKAAENGDIALFVEGASVASMRPRHKAAENVAHASALGKGETRFNEAAA